MKPHLQSIKGIDIVLTAQTLVLKDGLPVSYAHLIHATTLLSMCKSSPCLTYSTWWLGHLLSDKWQGITFPSSLESSVGSFVAETEFNLLTFKPRSVIVMGAEADHAWTGSCLYVADPRRSEKGRWWLLLVWGSGVIGRVISAVSVFALELLFSFC